MPCRDRKQVTLSLLSTFAEVGSRRRKCHYCWFFLSLSLSTAAYFLNGYEGASLRMSGFAFGNCYGFFPPWHVNSLNTCVRVGSFFFFLLYFTFMNCIIDRSTTKAYWRRDENWWKKASFWSVFIWQTSPESLFISIYKSFFLKVIYYSLFLIHFWERGLKQKLNK